MKKNKTLPNGVSRDKEPMDAPLEPDELTYSKKNKTLPLAVIHDSNMAKINELENAWKKNKASESPEEVVKESIEMSKSSIKSIVKHSNALMMGLNEKNQDCLSEPWISSKLTIVEDYIRSIHDYIIYSEKEEEDDDDQQEEDEADYERGNF